MLCGSPSSDLTRSFLYFVAGGLSHMVAGHHGVRGTFSILVYHGMGILILKLSGFLISDVNSFPQSVEI